MQRTIPILFFLEAIQQAFYVSFLGKTFSQGILFKIELRTGIAPPTQETTYGYQMGKEGDKLGVWD